MARQVGRTPSSMCKYISVSANELRNDAKSELGEAKATDTMRKAGVLEPDGTPEVATIRVTGRVHVRSGDEIGHDYRTRTLDFGNSDVAFSAAALKLPTTPTPPPDGSVAGQATGSVMA